MNKVHRVCVILISINHSDLSLSGKNNRSPVCDFLSAFLFFIIQLCVCVCVFLLSAVINFTFYLFHWTMSSVNAINFIALYIEIATFSIDKSCVISDKIWIHTRSLDYWHAHAHIYTHAYAFVLLNANL